MTHDQLLKKAARWLKRHDQNMLVPNCGLVLTDLSTAHCSRPDVLGFNSHTSVLLEVKVSRRDFLADKKKKVRIVERLEVGELRYYISPPEIIKVEDLPPGWGLIHFSDRKFTIEKLSEKFPANLKGERKILLSHIRRQK